MTTSNQHLTKQDLRQFTGSELWYRHGLVRWMLYTEGAKYVAEQGRAYWLLDELVLAQKSHSAVAAEAFQLWKLQVNADQTALLTCEDGNGNTVLTKKIAYTNFPLEEITLYVTGNVILLPSEY